jgi:phospho-N-acetylmuramoyl-pentapeptide-transferase
MKEILLAGTTSTFLSFFLTPIFIRFLSARGYGQNIRDDGPTSHHVKRGTPTMGGVILIAAAIIGYFTSHLINGVRISVSALLVIGLVLGLGLVGFLDDWLKIVKGRSLGLRAKQKLAGQVIVAGGFALAGLHFKDTFKLTPISFHLSTVRDTSLVLGTVFVVVWVIFLVLATSNGVNLTDGLDGLASGTSIMTLLAFVLIGVWEFRQSCGLGSSEVLVSKCYQVRDPLDLAVLAAAFAGSCAGFLWWNTSPAKIFMGDVGSLALGGALAGLAITLRIEMLLAALGGLFVIITMSVIIQTLYFKASGGKRVFRMAPLQHHFELLGWAEVTIVIRFWIIAGLSVAAGLGLFYAQWVTS